MIEMTQLRLRVKESLEKLRQKCAGILHIPNNKIDRFLIIRKSIDARKKPDIFFSYTVRLSLKGGVQAEKSIIKRFGNKDIRFLEDSNPSFSLTQHIGTVNNRPISASSRPLVVGFGPAGIFASLILARSGLCPIVYERGAPIDERVRDVSLFWENGLLCPDSNPQFGEGGAGAFSDGKLNTLIKDREGRNRFVLEEFVKHGADCDILINAKPHIGSDCLHSIVRAFREEIVSLGGEILFHRKFTSFDMRKENNRPIVLAIGHSARDSFEELYESGLQMEAKDFAMGLRIQHPQSLIDFAMYGKVDDETKKILGPATYRLSHTAKNGRSVYSFCMCPGGYVVNASSEEGHLSVNGMSYHARDGINANAAIIVSIRKEDFQSLETPLGGIYLQRELEKRAFELGGGRIPMQRLGDFRRRCQRDDTILVGSGEAMNSPIIPAFKGQWKEAQLQELFHFSETSPFSSLNGFNDAFLEGMAGFGKSIPGFNHPEAILAGVESRTSSPVRIPRSQNLCANIENVFPCGEGAGYAGGIMSAAMDGIRVAEQVLKIYRHNP